VANLRPSDTSAPAQTVFKSFVVGILALSANAGALFARAAGVHKMEHREPIIKSEYVVAIAHIATAIGLLAIIAMILFAMP